MSELPASASDVAPILPTSTAVPDANALPFPATDLPQDPFYPHTTAVGPIFLDTQACVCSLQPNPDPDASDPAWRCLGNSTSDIYIGTSGKWYNPVGDASKIINGSIDDASTPPDTNDALVVNNQTDALEPLSSVHPDPLSVFDDACTGVNETLFSTAYYRAAQEQANHQTPVDAAPCWRPGGYPVQIQNVSSWQTTGCYPGFFCSYHSVSVAEHCQSY